MTENRKSNKTKIDVTLEGSMKRTGIKKFVS